MIPLEVGGLGGLVFFFILIMFGPPILLTVIGFAVKKKHPTAAKVLFILATIYAIAGLGICGGVV